MSEPLNVKLAEGGLQLTLQLNVRQNVEGSAGATGTTSHTEEGVSHGACSPRGNPQRKSSRTALIQIRFTPVIDRLPACLQRVVRAEVVPKWARCRLAQKYVATPAWADSTKTQGVYREAARMRRNGEEVVVDHIVPLNHPHVCGLHWHENLCIIGGLENNLKSNNFWPDSWNLQEHLDLPGDTPHQLTLDL